MRVSGGESGRREANERSRTTETCFQETMVRRMCRHSEDSSGAPRGSTSLAPSGTGRRNDRRLVGLPGHRLARLQDERARVAAPPLARLRRAGHLDLAAQHGERELLASGDVELARL